MNYTTIAGHLGADPETRFTSSGKKVTTLRVAVRSRKGKKEEETMWWKVTIWGELFDNILPYFKKGSPIIALGEMMKPEIFNDREGRPQISLNLVAHTINFSPFGRTEKKNEEQSVRKAPMDEAASSYQYDSHGQGAVDEFNEEEIPF